MRYSNDRLINEVEHVKNCERETINIYDLESFLGDNNYLNKVEEMLLDILNYIYPLDDAVNDICEHKELV